MSVFNKDNKGYEGKYPLFFGEELGLLDTINRTYPQLEELYQMQWSQLWNEFEVDLSQDKMDMREAPEGVKDLMVKTISWQHLADSVVSKSVVCLLMPHVTNSELEGLVNLWGTFETIHARTYSHIIKQTFENPAEMLKETYENVAVLTRSEAIINAFENLEGLPTDAPMRVKRAVLLKALVALFALEAIAFMASFAITFGISERKMFQGVSKLVQLVCRDEALHTRFDYAIISILRADPEWDEAFEDCKPDIKRILDSVVEQEMNWSDYLFSEGRECIGLNSGAVKSYVKYVAKPVYGVFGVECDFTAPPENPLPYMEKYLAGSSIQVAPQELQNSSYQIGAIVNDTEGLDLDFDM